ncbi:aldo/keto reductase [Litorilinea aerophila]|uniref:Aldo/keto reductase n=1 Tax=Litorilinea aerophila TaxID=1204385 RepID=A0A540VIB0_9CHLR|nr:aldo/keto reductase [Litorilinea aerophila]MCC9075743.1 aldo/keto reductase [Litorilinea aerophila]
MIPTATLGRNPLQVSRLGLGTAPLSGLYRPVSDEEAVTTIQYALEQGITLFDTAPLYGRGRSEALVGKALAGIPRDRYQLSTKVGRLLNPETGEMGFDFSRDGVLRSLEGSLARLQTDRVEILHIHDPDNHLEQALEQAYPTLVELRRQGVIRAVGAGMNQWQALWHLARHGEFDCFLLAGRYTLLEQEALPFLDYCLDEGIGLLLGGVFNSGILATGPVPGARYNYREAPPAILERVAAIEAVCRRHGVPLPAAALQFARSHGAVASLVVGAVSPDEIAQNLEAWHRPIPSALWEELRSQALIAPGAPIPSSHGA